MVHTYYDPYSGRPAFGEYVYIPSNSSILYSEIVDQKPNGNPTAFITVGKSRKKLYSKNSVQTVFLKDGEEFELELFNPTQFTVGAQIFLNGEAISERKYILRPGQRAFIERHIDTPAKLKFSTYEVESGDAQVDAAIKENGAVEVKFFKEYKPVIRYAAVYPQHKMYSASVSQKKMRSASPFDSNQLLGQTASYSASVDSLASFTSASPLSTFEDNTVLGFTATAGTAEVPAFKETGRIEEGARSDQSFSQVAMTFEYAAFASTKLKMEPVSAQPVDEIRVYCSECGRKQKPGEKFCPSCGKKHE